MDEADVTCPYCGETVTIRLDPAGGTIYASFLGGSNADGGLAIGAMTTLQTLLSAPAVIQRYDLLRELMERVVVRDDSVEVRLRP